MKNEELKNINAAIAAMYGITEAEASDNWEDYCFLPTSTEKEDI